jgi:hypothetical protein
MINFRKLSAIVWLISALSFSAHGQDSLPVPPSSKDLLFYLQRSTNANTVIYELQHADTVVDAKNPVHPSWILYAKKGEKEDLDYIQRKFAYGIKSNKIADNDYELKFVSYDKYKLELMRGADNKLHVYTTINNKKAILTRIYLKIEGGTFWFPHIEYVEVFGIDPSNNAIVKERIKV